MTEAELLESYKRNAVAKIIQKRQLSFSFTTFDSIYSDLSSHVLSRILGEYKLNYLETMLMTFIREIVNNAVKANLKRVFFKEKGLSLNNEDGHTEALADFRENALMQIKDYSSLLKKNDLKVHFSVLLDTNGFHLVVKNNVKMTPKEMSRIQKKLQQAKEVENLFELLSMDEDENEDEEADDEGESDPEREGAGLGLCMNLLLLKKTGIDVNNFQILVEEENTVAKLFVPAGVARPELVNYIENKIENNLKSIGTFPETTQKLISMCSNPNVNIAHISQEIKRDPSLCATLLRMVNSGAFYTCRSGQGKINSLSRAIMILGLKGVRQLITYHTTSSILSEHHQICRDFQEHSEKCAIYASKIAELTGNREKMEAVYLGGLLHDIGNVVLYSVDPSMIKLLNNVNSDRTANATAVIEEISLGISHTEVGEKLASKWSFSEDVIQMISFHHTPFASNKKYLKEVSIVHLADAFSNVEKRHKNYNYLDIEAQAELGIFSHIALEKLRLKVRDACYITMKEAGVA